MKPRRSLLLLCGAFSIATLSATQPEQELPRFRAGANLVRVDAYVNLDGKPVKDLTAEDFELFEDDKPQKVEGFEFVDARNPAVVRPSTPTSTRDMLAAAQDPEARLFVIYLDIWHMGVDGSYRAPEPIARMLEQVIGPNDLVALMTPEITPQNLTLIRRGDGLERLLRDSWTWGQRDRIITEDPREEDLRGCYPDGRYPGVAAEIIGRRREQKVLRSLDSTVGYLGSIRDERKFVVLLSNGWVLYRRSERLGEPLDGQAPTTRQPIGTGTDGRVTTGNPREGGASNLDWCERERTMMAFIDHVVDVRELAQRANRANVSFYPVDTRGATAFDTSVGPDRPLSPAADGIRLAARQNALRDLAHQTDGDWVLNTNNTAEGLQRILADTGSYYLLSYYSTNPKLDGRFRRVTVRVKRDGADVRSRPGYLAPTEAEARAMGATVGGPGVTGRAAPPPAVSRALDAIVPGRGSLPVRVQASGLAGKVRVVVELDVATLKRPEWTGGASVQITIETDRGGNPKVITETMAAGQRSIVIEGPDETLTAGRYIVRAEARSMTGSASVRASTDTVVATSGATIGTSTIALRRGPTTGLAYQPTADPRFRRTERLRLEVPILAAGAVNATGKVLTREGQPLQVQVTLSERAAEQGGQRFLIADATLAPLAQGDFVLEVTAGKESATYGFRIVP